MNDPITVRGTVLPPGMTRELFEELVSLFNERCDVFEKKLNAEYAVAAFNLMQDHLAKKIASDACPNA